MSISRDEVTLVIAIWGAVTGTGGFLYTRRENHWKHVYANLAPLREPIDDLAEIVEPPDPQINQSLFSVTAGSHIETLRTTIDQIPGWLTRRHINALVSALTAFKGGQQPAQTDGSPAPFTRSQQNELKTARGKLAKVEKRLNTAAKKGRS